MSVFLYDGDCAFCTSSASWLRRRAISATPIVPWQHADLAALNVSQEECEAAVQWVGGSTRSAGPDAVAAYLMTSTRGWRRVGHVLGSAPIRLIAWPTYRWVARHRHQLPGGTPACELSPPSRPEQG